ncbi:MAG: LysE family transporter [Chloroflexota bacterium]|nr:LysE family transporter [Chloroflexota bacterium]
MGLQIIIPGILMGIAFAAPPGAVTAETFRRGARGGFLLALGVQLGSLVGDVTYALLALAGFAALAQSRVMQIALGAFGALFLMYLAWSSFRTARGQTFPLPTSPERRREGEEVGAFLSGMTISLANPWAIAFWLSLGGALVSLGVANASMAQVATFFASFMFGVALWSVALVVIVGYMRNLMRPAIFRIISITCGIALGAFGVAAASRVVFSIIGI